MHTSIILLLNNKIDTNTSEDEDQDTFFRVELAHFTLCKEL